MVFIVQYKSGKNLRERNNSRYRDGNDAEGIFIFRNEYSAS